MCSQEYEKFSQPAGKSINKTIILENWKYTLKLIPCIFPARPLLDIYPTEMHTYFRPKDIHKKVHSSATHLSSKLETNQMSINRKMDTFPYIHRMEYYRANKLQIHPRNMNEPRHKVKA